MATPYTDIYTVFQSQISDVEFNSLSVVDAIQKQYLINSITNFRRCSQDLNNRNDTSSTFNITLTEDEKQILGNLMVLEYLSSQIVNLQNIKQVMTSKDFGMSSQANHLDKLLLLEEKRQKKVSKMIVDYTYNSGDLTKLK
jgi:hypothetical protein